MKRIVVMIVSMLLCLATFAQTSQSSFSQLLTKARNGDVEAMYDVSVRYYNGDGVEKNERESFNWTLKAAQKGHVDAMVDVAYGYFYGIGVEVDEDEAFEWMLKAAEAGDIEAMEYVAEDYLLYGFEDDAYTWYSKAAGKGSTIAVLALKKMKKKGYTPKPGIAANPKPNNSQPAENERKEYRDYNHVFVKNAAARANASDPTVYDKTLHFNDPKALRCYGKIAKNGGELWVLYRPDGTLFGKFYALTYFDKGAPNCFLFMRDFQTEKIGVYDIYGKKLLDHQFDWIGLTEIPINNGYYAISGGKTINGEDTNGLYDVLYNVCNIPSGIYKAIHSVDQWMNVVVVGKNRKFGVINMKQEVVVPIEYEMIYHKETTGPNQMYYKVYKYGAADVRMWGLYLKGQQILPCQYKESEVDRYIEEHP